MSVDILGTSCDQCRSMVQYSFTSTETRRLVRTDSPGRPPRLSHSSWTMGYTRRHGPVYTRRACRHLPSAVPWISEDRLFLCCETAWHISYKFTGPAGATGKKSSTGPQAALEVVLDHQVVGNKPLSLKSSRMPNGRAYAICGRRWYSVWPLVWRRTGWEPNRSLFFLFSFFKPVSLRFDTYLSLRHHKLNRNVKLSLISEPW